MTRRILGATVAIVAFALLGIASSSTLEAKGQGVTFQNRSDSVQYVLARFGEGGACTERAEKEQIKLEKGEKIVLESGADDVCWCASSAGKIGDCGNAWKKAKPGSFKKIF